ncbi:MAG: protein-disulfide reductase DsbD domain-containing protein [Bacteroidota bacterium]
MRSLKYCLLFLSVFCAASSFAQMIADPTTWRYEVKKKSATEYQLITHLELKQGWHIWSLKPGGDGYEIAPSFTFDKCPGVTMVGKPTEKGKATTTTMEGIDGKVTYLSGKIDYIQNVKVAGKATIKGKHEYQVCNDKMCLPPKTKDFEFAIK